MTIIEKSQEVHRNAVEHGWYDDKVCHDTTMSNVIGEVAETMGAIANNRADDRCDKGIDLTNLEEEIADVDLRTLDYIGYLRYASFVIYDDPVIRERIQFLFKGKSDGAMIGTLIKSIVHNFRSGTGYDYILAMVEEYAIIKGVDLERAVMVKHEYNKTRPFKHGGKKF
jgi:NTP pyrophosphatase (non-canonical NTP hydrolase)